MIRQTKTTITGKKPKMGKSIIIDADDAKTKTAETKKKSTKAEKAADNASETISNETAEGGI